MGSLSLLSERLTTWLEIIALLVFVSWKRNAVGATSCAATTKLAAPTRYGNEYSARLFICMTATTLVVALID
jgi:hypothetical protein